MNRENLLPITALIAAILFGGQGHTGPATAAAVDTSRVRAVVAVETAIATRPVLPQLPDDFGNLEDPAGRPQQPEPLPRDARPVVIAYIGDTSTCLPCRVLDEALRSSGDAGLPFRVEPRKQIPSWVQFTPTFHWQDSSGGWRQTSGFQGDWAPLLAAWRPTQAPQVSGVGVSTMSPPGAIQATSSDSIRSLVDGLFATVGKGEVRLNDNYSVMIPETTTIVLRRNGSQIAVDVQGPTPLVRLSYFGVRYDARLQGIAIEPKRAVLRLGGFPDVPFAIE